MSVCVHFLVHLGQTARLIFPSVTRWPVLFTAVARICMRRPLLRITKAPRLHPGPSSIIYFTLNAGTRSAFSELSCKVRCRSFCSCPCKKWLVSSRRKSEVHAPASVFRGCHLLPDICQVAQSWQCSEKTVWWCSAGAAGRSRARCSLMVWELTSSSCWADKGDDECHVCSWKDALLI